MHNGNKVTNINDQLNPEDSVKPPVRIVPSRWRKVYYEYHMTNIFQVSYILSTYHTSLQARETKIKYEKLGKYWTIVRGKRAITNLSLLYKISTVC